MDAGTSPSKMPSRPLPSIGPHVPGRMTTCYSSWLNICLVCYFVSNHVPLCHLEPLSHPENLSGIRSRWRFFQALCAHALQFDHIGLGGLSEVLIFVEGLEAWFLAQGACRNPSESGAKLKLTTGNPLRRHKCNRPNKGLQQLHRIAELDKFQLKLDLFLELPPC